jgi:sirohydrochlorin cobaltochelatase
LENDQQKWPLDDFSDAALVLAGHGSTLNADSAAPVFQHVRELRRRGIFSQVREAFWKQEPFLGRVMREVFAPRVFVVPLFISDGFFAGEAIPHELGFCRKGETRFSRVQQRGGQTLFYCGPVGTHPRMTEVLLARVREVVEKYPFPRAPEPAKTTLFIAGHGTGRNENSRKAIERQVELIRARNLFARVHAVFMEEEPRVGDCWQLAPTENIVVAPFFISDGMHSFEDIPVMLGSPRAVVRERLELGQPTWRNPTEREGKRLWYAGSVGSEPLMADVIMDRVRESAQERTRATAARDR